MNSWSIHTEHYRLTYGCGHLEKRRCCKLCPKGAPTVYNGRRVCPRCVERGITPKQQADFKRFSVAAG